MSAATWSGDHGGAEEAEADVGRGAINVRRESAATAARDGHGSIALLYAAGPLSKELPVAMQERVGEANVDEGVVESKGKGES